MKTKTITMISDKQYKFFKKQIEEYEKYNNISFDVIIHKEISTQTEIIENKEPVFVKTDDEVKKDIKNKKRRESYASAKAKKEEIKTEDEAIEKVFVKTDDEVKKDIKNKKRREAYASAKAKKDAIKKEAIKKE